MRLIPNWRRAHRMLSVQSMALAGVIQGAWLAVPDDMKSSLPPHIVQWVSLILLFAGIAGRLFDQKSTK